MPSVEHKFISVYTKSDTNSYANTDFDPFVPSNHSSATIESVVSGENDFSYDTGTGEITCLTGGQYLAILSVNPDSTSGANLSILAKIKVNGTQVFGSTFAYNNTRQNGGSEKTFNTKLSLSDNDIVSITLNSSAADTMFARAGCSLTLISQDSAYAQNIRTGGTVETGLEHNPFQSGTYSSNYSSAFSSVSGGIGYNDSGWDSTYGPAVLLNVCNFLPTDSAATLQNITYKLYKNTSATITYSSKTPTSMEPNERSIISLASASSGDYFKPTMIPASGDIYASSGSSHFIGRMRDDGYLSMIVTSTSNAISSVGDYGNFLDQANHSSFAKTDLISPADISFSSVSGDITIGTDGYYYLSYVGVLGASADLFATGSIRKNSTSINDGTLLLSSRYRIDSDASPVERTLSGIFQFSANDTIQFWFTKESGGNLTQEYAIVTALKVGDSGGGGGGGGGYGESTGRPLYGSDKVINTYSKSNQHLRYVEQIPFGMQIPGPLSLRNRTQTTIVTGKKYK